MKTAVKIILSIILAFIILYGLLFISLFIVPFVFDENATVDLNNIGEEEKQSIIKLMNLEEVEDNINLIKLEEISGQDIYYKIYFNSDIEDLSNHSKSYEIYVDIQKEADNNYICTLSNEGNSIGILENLLNKNENS